MGKNHGSPYKEMFNHNLVSNFAYIFQQVSEKAKTPKEIAKAAQVRSLLYKLRLTWGGSYQVFTPTVLHQLDVKIKKIDPAWPVTHPKTAPSAPVPIDRSASNTKIHVNPNFVSKTVKEKTPPMEDETERMRAELLKKEAELIKLKQMLQLKKEMPGQKPVTDGSTISSTTSPGLTPERKSPPSVNSSSAAPSLPQAEKTKKVRCLLREANISYSIQKIINRELINGLSNHSDLLLRFDISPPVIQSLARLILKLDRGPCFHERNSLSSDNNELFLKWK